MRTGPSDEGTRIAPPLRAWLIVEVVFGLAAMATIALRPQDSATNFAWPIKPDVTAALLGAFYMSSAWVFVLAAFARRWETIRVMMIPAILFTSTELMATLLHWDKFTVDSTPFVVWFASYLLPPPILAACYLWQRSHSTSRPGIDPIPRSLLVAMTVIGAMLAGEGIAAFIWPRILISSAPWDLSPLTARAICGWLIALGTMLLFAARDGHRERTLVVSPFFILVGPSIVLQTLRFHKQVDWTHPRVLINAIVLSIVFAIGVYLALGDWASYFRRSDREIVSR